MARQQARLGDLCRVVRGASPRPKGDPRYFGGDIPWVTIGDVTRSNGVTLLSTTEHVTEAGRGRSRYVEPGQLIVSNSATIGVPIFMGVGGCIHDGFLTFLDVDSRLTLDWLYWYFRVARTSLERIAPEGTQKNLNTDIVENLLLPLPSTAEQQLTADRLFDANRLVMSRGYAYELSAKYLESAFRQEFGNALTLGPYRELGDLVRITGGGTPSRDNPDYYTGSTPWLTPKDMQADYIWDTEEHITAQAIAESAARLVPAHSILVVVKSKVLMHRLPVAIGMIPVAHGQDIKSLQCESGWDYEYVRFMLKRHEPRLIGLARGANTEGLNLSMLQELPIPDVDYEQQLRFHSLVDRHESLRSAQREACRQAELLLAALLFSAFLDGDPAPGAGSFGL